MRVKSRRKSIAFFITLGACLVVLAVVLNVGWVLLNWREVALLISGVIVFGLLITGVVLNTTFLVREIRRNEQHDSFINAVTHELKTPITSIRLYLETLQTREVEAERRAEFYDIMLADADRLLQTVEQVLRAGHTGQRRRRLQTSRIDMSQMTRECLELARTRYHLNEEALHFSTAVGAGESASVTGDADELRAAISNLIDNAVKYSGEKVDVSVAV
ncbi:MAG: sensor histidine kinase, partial [Acidobacteria bacterium]|nr:sensor histidine kinase [Acidobacteriota bacterium]